MKKHTKKICNTVILLAVIAGLFTGCSSSETPDDGPVPPDGGNLSLGDTQPAETEVTVSSIEELVEAIAPNTKIILEPGSYILSEYLDEVWEVQGEMWNVNHEYVQIRECYDGLELLIQNVAYLSISGGTGEFNDTQIVTEPRYATVLNFYQCSEVEMKSITIGHTDYSSCEGNVLDFYGCNDVRLDNMDIFGCGLYGIGAMKNCGNITVNDSFIRDCSDGSLWLDGGTGTYEFNNCVWLVPGAEAVILSQTVLNCALWIVSSVKEKQTYGISAKMRNLLTANGVK